MERLKLIWGAVFVMFFPLLGNVYAADKYWDGMGSDSRWETDGNWQGDSKPSPNGWDDVYLYPFAFKPTIIYGADDDYNLSNLYLGSDSSNYTAGFRLQDNDHSLNISLETLVGQKGSARFDYTSNRFFHTNTLQLGGSDSASYGEFYISGNSSNLDAFSIYVGYENNGNIGGLGKFVQSKGKVSASELSVRGKTASNQSSYELADGFLTVNALSVLDGAEFVQKGGSLKEQANTFWVKDGAEFILNNGTAEASQSVYITGGTFSQANGSFNIGSTLYLQEGGLYQLSSGDVTADGLEISQGEVSHSGGSFALTNAIVGINDSATYTLSDGANLSVASKMEISSKTSPNAQGKVSQQGGAATINDLNINNNGEYQLSGGILTVSGNENVNKGGKFTQTGGNSTVMGDLTVNEGGTYDYNGSSAVWFGLSADKITNNGEFYHRGGNIASPYLYNYGDYFADSGVVLGTFSNEGGANLFIGGENAVSSFSANGFLSPIVSDFNDLPTVYFDIFGTERGVSYDTFLVNDNIWMGSELISINLLNNFVPSEGDVFTLFSAGNSLYLDDNNVWFDFPYLSDGLWWDVEEKNNNLNLIVRREQLPSDSTVPEPMSMGLFGIGLLLAVYKRKRIYTAPV